MLNAQTPATLLTISVMACATTLADCARNPGQRDLHAARHEVRAVPVYFEPHRSRYGSLRIHRPPAALLAPQPEPDCEFKGAKVEPMDPTALARLKLDYERRCYRNAERAVRERLRLLQASVR